MRLFDIAAELVEGFLTVVDIDQSEALNLAAIIHQVDKFADLHTVNLAVDDLEIAKLVGYVLDEERL